MSNATTYQQPVQASAHTELASGGDDGPTQFWLLRLISSPLLWLGVVIVLGHLLYLLGIFDPNPVLLHSNISVGVRGQVYVGTNSLDPNDGFTSQALAHRAMLDWIGGQVPWWNPFEGVGAALAGEMQSAAFFPFAILTLLPNGQMWMYLLLCMVGGYSTYFLVRRLGISPWIAFVAAVCFGLNGTFAWFRFAPANPIAFLPVMLLGVEIARERVQQGRRSHWWIIAVGLSLSLLAGFPETAYLDVLLVILWTIARCWGLTAAAVKRFLTVTVGGAVTGVLLSGPLLAAIAAYLPSASLGPNTDTSTQILPPRGLATLFFPYGYGTLWSHIGGRYGHLIADVWGTVGGYTTVALLLLATYGLFHRELRALKVVLAVWCAAMICGAYGVPVIRPLLRLIPGMTHMVIARYMNPTLTMALVVLAAFGLRDVIRARLSWRQLLLASAGVTLVAALVAKQGADVSQKVPHAESDFTNAVIWGFFTIAVIIAAAVTLKWRAQRTDAVGRRGVVWRIAAVALIVLLPVEAVGMFVLPELSAPQRGHVDMRLVDFLQRHIGHERFATLGPILPNYGSYYGIASIMENDLPMPRRFSHLILHDLDPNSNPITFTGTVQVRYPGLTPVGALRRYLRNYEALGVKYLLVSTAHPTRHPHRHLREYLGDGPGHDRGPAGDRAHTRREARDHARRDTRDHIGRNRRDRRGRDARDHHAARDAHGRGHRDDRGATGRHERDHSGRDTRDHHHRRRTGNEIEARVRDHKVKLYPAYLGHCSRHHLCRGHKLHNPRVYHHRLPRALRGMGLRRVYGDALAVVYELPHTQGLFHADRRHCTLDVTGWYSAHVRCTRPGAVVYNQVTMPGWTATVNGQPTTITATRLSQQRIHVGAGESTIVFRYRPQYATAGWIAALIGLVACLFSAGLFSRPLARLRRSVQTRRLTNAETSQ